MSIIWKVLDGYSRYEISNSGLVRNIKTGALISGSMSQGYICVTLYPDTGKQKAIRLHRIVATLFCDKKEGHTIVNHIDGNKTNNVSSNLEWTTARENTRHAVSIGKIVGNNFKRVQRICPKSGEIKVYSSIKEAFEDNKDKLRYSSYIVSVCSGGQNTAGGYIWKYVDEIDKSDISQNLLPKIQGRIPSENIDSLDYYLKRFSPSFPQFNFCEMPYLSKLILYEEISGDTKESYNLLKFLIEDIKIELEPFVFDEKSFIILSDSPFHLCLRNYNEFKKEVLKIYVKNKVDINYTIDGKNTYDYIIQLPSNHKKEILELIKPIYSPPVDTSKNEYENLKAYLDTQIEVQRARLRQHDVLLANISVLLK